MKVSGFSNKLVKRINGVLYNITNVQDGAANPRG